MTPFTTEGSPDPRGGVKRPPVGADRALPGQAGRGDFKSLAPTANRRAGFAPPLDGAVI